MSQEKNKSFGSSPTKSIIPSIIKGSAAMVIGQSIWAVVVAYLYKKEFALNLLVPSLKSFILEENIPFVVLALLAAFQWMVMPSWTVSSRLAYGGYNFNSPRLSQRQLRGSFERLQSAYENAIETYPSIISAILVAKYNQIPVQIQVNLSLLYLALRTIWFAAYMINLPAVRGITFNLANWSMLYLFLFSTIINFEEHFNYLTSFF